MTKQEILDEIAASINGYFSPLTGRWTKGECNDHYVAILNGLSHGVLRRLEAAGEIERDRFKATVGADPYCQICGAVEPDGEPGMICPRCICGILGDPIEDRVINISVVDTRPADVVRLNLTVTGD